MAKWDIDNTLSALNLLAGIADDYQKNKLAYEIQVQKTELDEKKFERVQENDKYTRDLNIIKMFQDSSVPGLPAEKYKQTSDALMNWADTLPKGGDMYTAALGVNMGILNSGEKATAIADFDAEMLSAESEMNSYQEEFKSNNYSNVNNLDSLITDLKDSLINNSKFISASQKQIMQKMISQFEGQASVREIMAGFDADGDLTKFDIDEATFNAQTYTNPYTNEKIKSGMEYFRMAENFANAGEWEKSLTMLQQAPGKQTDLVNKTITEIDNKIEDDKNEAKTLYDSIERGSQDTKTGGIDSNNYSRWNRISEINDILITGGVNTVNTKLSIKPDVKKLELEGGHTSKYFKQKYPDTQEGLKEYQEDLAMAKDNFNRDNFDDYVASVEATKVKYQASANISSMDLNYDAAFASFGELLPDDTKFNLTRPIIKPDSEGKKVSQITAGNRRTAVESLINNLKPMWNMGGLGNGENAGFFGKEILSKGEVGILTNNETGQIALELKEKTLLDVLNRVKYNNEARGEIAYQLSGDIVIDDDNYFDKEAALDDLRGYYLGLWSQGKLYAPSGDVHNLENQKIKAVMAMKNFLRSLKKAGTSVNTIEFRQGHLMSFGEELMGLGWDQGSIMAALLSLSNETF